MSIAELRMHGKTERYFNRWSRDATTTMLGTEGDEFGDPPTVQAPPSGCIIYGVPVAVPAAFRSQKAYWQSPPPISSLDVPASGCLIAFEGTPEQVGFPGDAVASTSPWPELWSKPTTPATHTRGLVVVDHRREELFETTVNLDTAKLPRWRPFIAEYRRTHEENNE
jgi:hypothetical protein